MAEPLTTTDIFRIRSGWGTGGDTAERQRWAAAGLSPATTEERERVRLGRGASALASPEARTAMVAEEVRTGKRPESDLPEEYGGRPQITVGARYDEKGQPVGTYRRQLRMQEAWDARQSQLAEQQRIAQQLDLQQRAESRLQRDQDFEIEKARMLEDRETRVQKEAGAMIDSIRGAIAPDGTVISRPIRPEDDDAIERLDNLARDFKLGVENKAAASMFSTLYNDALKYREEKLKQGQQQELAAINLSVKTGKPFQEFGTYNEQGIFQPRAQGMIAGAEEVKAAEEAKAQEATVATEKRRAETAADVAEERDKKLRRRQLDEDILTEEQTLIDFQNQKPSPSRDTEIKKAEAKLKNLHLRRGAIEGLTSDDLIYKDQDAYKKAIQDGKKIPSGTTIYIGGIPAKVK